MRSLSDEKLDHLRSLAAHPDFSGTKYRVLQELAHGGMGTVYLARDEKLSRQVAIKVLNAADGDDADLTRRMVREAQIIAQLEHSGIVPVHDVGELADGRVFYAMKLVRGERLDEYAARVPSLKERLRKFQAVCDAVSFAHAHAVIHRDLKPQNIMIGSFGEVLVLDWGIAKVLERTTSRDDSLEAETLRLHPRQHLPSQNTNTLAGTIIGTAKYMSPEQERGEIERLNERSDVYSLGAILYFLLTNATPGPRKPRELNPTVGKAAEAVCLRAMAASESDRYHTAAELASDVAHLLDDGPVSAYKESWWEKARRWISKNRFLVLIVLAYLLIRAFFIFAWGR